jgi:hypothetical protein
MEMAQPRRRHWQWRRGDSAAGERRAATAAQPPYAAQHRGGAPAARASTVGDAD